MALPVASHMLGSDPQRSSFPSLPHESLYVGVDIGKHQHVAGFVSTTLLQRHGRFEGCPALVFAQSRDGFRSLVDRICTYVPLQQCFVLVEQTGHYHKALEQYLLELDVAVYLIHVQRRPNGLLKTDKRDALGLANHLYNQLEKGIQVGNALHLVRRILPPTPAAAVLAGLVRHRYELNQERVRRKNKLIAICDELFPEFTQVCKDPTTAAALALRAQFPTPQTLAAASLAELRAARHRYYPSTTQLGVLQRLAAASIGTKDVARQRGLIVEQAQLITELRLIQTHLAELDVEITTTALESREGRILISIPGIGPIQAATLLAAIGNIANFHSAAALKSYCGWAPTLAQSGSSLNRSGLTYGGQRTLRYILYLIVWNAIDLECEWATLYAELVPRKCRYDERTRRYIGKGKVIGRVAGQIVTMIYALLKTDQERLRRLPPGVAPPEPMLYDRNIHHAHRHGQYRPLKRSERPQPVEQLARSTNHE